MLRLPTSLTLALFLSCCPWAVAAPLLVNIVVPAGYLSGIPLVVRVELRNEQGQLDRETWDADALLSVDNPNATLSTNRVRLYNGLGTGLVTVQGGEAFALTVQVGDLSTTRTLENLDTAPVNRIGGPLPGTETTWSGVVRVTNDVVVPENHTLTIASNTWVLVDAVESGTVAPDLIVHGTIRSMGSATHPVTITSSDPVRHWGQIYHDNAQPSAYTHTIITRGGQAPREPHTFTGPAVRITNSVVAFKESTIADHMGASGLIGKALQAYESEITFEGCVMARCRMGPELIGCILRATNTYFMEMTAGIDDEDALYIHYQGPGRRSYVVGCVVANVTDDGIDAVGSGVTIEDCIIRDVTDKGISTAQGETHGSTQIERCLIVDCGIGMSVKGTSTNTARINRSTILGRNRGLAATTSQARYFVTNSIVQATAVPSQSLFAGFDPARFQIYYSDILNTNWPGPGNINQDPGFVNPAEHDYRLRADSPCVDRGDPASPPDLDTTRADLGAFPLFQRGLLRLSNPQMNENGQFSFSLLGSINTTYLIQSSSNLTSWTDLERVTNNTTVLDWKGQAESMPHQFYRVLEVQP